ncbi:pyridoxamine 5'-phosphate oxidase [Rhodobacterales bacterium HKCCE2091]|nr:pyridoxamine 5'-phosphate oxidase [Rhodobacterales bacterium HKCCE2091]
MPVCYLTTRDNNRRDDAVQDDRSGIFAGTDPFSIAQAWLDEAGPVEPNDPNAMALATVDADGLPNVRIVLLKEIESDGQGGGGLVFYTNYGSAKAAEIDATGKGAVVLHWKSLRRQVRARGRFERVGGAQADAYFASRHPDSRVGAWASRQSEPLESRAKLVEAVAAARAEHGSEPDRPPHWGGFRLVPEEFEFWADAEHRLHDRFKWRRVTSTGEWTICRLFP